MIVKLKDSFLASILIFNSTIFNRLCVHLHAFFFSDGACIGDVEHTKTLVRKMTETIFVYKLLNRLGSIKSANRKTSAKIFEPRQTKLRTWTCPQFSFKFMLTASRKTGRIIYNLIPFYFQLGVLNGSLRS